MFLNTISGRFLLLTVVFVMLAEILIFVPSVARFREDYLQARLERGQIASLSVLANVDDMVDPKLEQELLENAGVLNVVLQRDEMRELVLSSPMPQAVSASFDLRDATPWTLIRDAFARLFDPEDRVIRVIGTPVNAAGLLIEVTLHTRALHDRMLDYGRRILLLSAFISVITAALLYFAFRGFLVVPMNRVVHSITAYKEAPEDIAQIIEPTAKIAELHEAEAALRDMQVALSAALRQKDRLATLGGAVAKISHDLRNMLTTAQLLADRMEASEDPAVLRTAPKLINSLTRAVHLCESTLGYGKAEEPAPVLTDFPLATLVGDIIESETLADTDALVTFEADLPSGMVICADQEQLFRILSNLVRNARQAIAATACKGTIRITAKATETSRVIEILDTGPGLPAMAREKLFRPFEGGMRKGGTGLGLAIAAELARGHDGALELLRSSDEGTVFRLTIPVPSKHGTG